MLSAVDMCLTEKQQRLLVLLTACFHQFTRAAFMSGSVGVFGIYYIERFNERTVSLTIASIQAAVAYTLSEYTLCIGCFNNSSPKRRLFHFSIES